jgi:murein L,D-transpeptidase YcbB/YkuD
VKPRYGGYRALERALARYRVLAADSTLRAPRRPAASVRPGDDYDDLPALVRLLAALGDLRSDEVDSVPIVTDSTSLLRYGGTIVDAVASFQRRHGLDPDGVIGPATMTELRVPLAQRVRQIELTLERWRWLPHRPPSRYLVVNVPGFRLYGFENDSAAERPVFATNVIVGRADRRHHTPVFSATMREIVFRPYWDVPPRIARTELVPIFRRAPSRFDDEGFEIVRPGAGEVNATIFPPTPYNLSRVAAGELRMRQRPGTANALGFIKFIFPNRYNVFLHDTPTRELFARVRRDFSHGCIRVSQPNALAEFVLRGQGTWDRTMIDSLMHGDRTLHVALDRPVSVFVVYATAAAAVDGTVHFYADLYKHDAALERALGLVPLTRR